MKQMLILTGPQGAGNHLWSKVFSLHSEVYGWKSLLNNYWEAHRFSEPFAKYWKNPELLKDFDWYQSDYYFTSISCPLGIIGSTENPIYKPNVMKFANAVKECGINVQFAIVGRDKNILNYQQTRIRSESTLDIFLEQLKQIPSPTFLSYELLYLYGADYLRTLNFNIPIAYNDVRIVDILSDDPNAKYIHNVEHNELDAGNKTGITFKNKP
jgi:hypothetical protein